MLEKVLIVDDEPEVRTFLGALLKAQGCEVEASAGDDKALKLLKEENFDLVFTGMKMKKLSGLDIIKKTKEASPNTLVVVMTAFGSIENAVEAMQLGAFHYLLKPFSEEIVLTILQKGKEHAHLVRENCFLKEEQRERVSSKEPLLIAISPAMKQVADSLPQIGESNASVFITGESGTGKEVIASTIHHHSPRREGPFIRVNCAAVPETLIEAEFFGYEKGAFTGAVSRKPGRFELAHRGTLLLDEVTEIPLGIQAKLLRAIQEGEFERLGGTKPIKVDVRIISTSNRNLEEALKEKILREDLYYRLNVIPIHLPPLHERKEDILLLADYFLNQFCQENRKGKKSLSASAKTALLSYAWPGNVRELANVIERAVVISKEPEIQEEHLGLASCVSS